MSKETNSLQEFLWNLSGHKKEIIQNCKADQYSASIIGVLMLVVGIYATIAWTFFLTTLTGTSPVTTLIFGLFAGIFIVSLDRAIISSLSAGKTNIFALGFRFVLALILGIFLSQPIILKLYESDIKREAGILYDEKVLERKAGLETQFASETEALKTEKEELLFALHSKADRVNKSKDDFKVEMDGSGGTGIYGYSTVSKKKEQIYLLEQKEFENLQENSAPQIVAIDNRLADIQDEINSEVGDYRANNGEFGFLIQVAALESLFIKDETHTLRNRYILLSLILILIELSALIAKMMLRTKSYGEKISLVIDQELAETNLARDISFSRIEKSRELVKNAELTLVEEFFKASKEVTDEKLAEMIQDWKTSKGTNLAHFWKKFQNEFTTEEKYFS